ncbi:hypothetical protein RHSIM_Rhsim13G0232900 [Rhododendron simsii]|uniref:Uncharacterized protein n=1 Tax=Rhododendron simsii TaxID=118357 RepID=A0A834L7N7_RHOSS|nr:hypothetical protein RHSIM_Rhsim13G0232900 [Rhododendron simsii]
MPCKQPNARKCLYGVYTCQMLVNNHFNILYASSRPPLFDKTKKRKFKAYGQNKASSYRSKKFCTMFVMIIHINFSKEKPNKNWIEMYSTVNIRGSDRSIRMRIVVVVVVIWGGGRRIGIGIGIEVGVRGGRVVKRRGRREAKEGPQTEGETPKVLERETTEQIQQLVAA